MGLYPEVAKSQNDTLSPPIKSIASLAEFQRIERLEGDLNMNAADRFQCEAYTDSGAGCYSYRFNAPIPMRVDSRLGVVHAAEIGPVLQNVGGGGFFINPFSGMNDNDEFRNMAKVMGIMWAGFIVSLDPNVGFANPTTTMGENVQQWPRFSREKRERMVFNSTGVWVEQDFARLEAMEYINRIQAGILQQ
jgi:carboxylesterase type B